MRDRGTVRWAKIAAQKAMGRNGPGKGREPKSGPPPQGQIFRAVSATPAPAIARATPRNSKWGFPALPPSVNSCTFSASSDADDHRCDAGILAREAPVSPVRRRDKDQRPSQAEPLSATGVR